MNGTFAKRTALLASVFSALALGAAGTLDLDGTWSLTAFPQPDDGAIRALPLPGGLATDSFQATVPGMAELEYVRAGRLPDPFYSTNCFAFLAYEGHQYLYERTFTAPARASGERQILAFDGLDTLCDVFLNGEKVGEADNMLIAQRFDVTGKLKQGAENRVSVLFRPILLAARDVVPHALGWTMGGGANHEYFRKAPCAYGWDTMPHLPLTGIWKSVRLETLPPVHIDHPYWFTMNADPARRSAYVGVRFRVTAPFRHYYNATFRCTLSRNGRTHTISDEVRGPMCTAKFGFGNADLWWPRGAGEAALYDATIEILGADGTVLAKDTRKFGLRTIVLEYDDRKLPERPGRFLFKINGEPIYVRGVDWIPLDPVPSEQKRHFAKVLPMMSDLNANLVRVWGGGVYEPEEFFDWCDANGVMVWQDFMMACAVPPMTDDFVAQMQREVTAVALRLRNHASLALWAGDNENDQAFRWSMGSLSPDPNFNRITRETIPLLLREFDPSRPYLPSSPYISRDAFAKRTEACEDHLWGGPRAWWKTAYYTNNACWFCSEGGGHGIPARASLERMMPKEEIERPWENPDERDILKLRWRDQWNLRATNPYLSNSSYLKTRNTIALKQINALFGSVPRHDVDLLIAQSQVAQAEAIKFQVEMFRSQKFTKKGGFVVWNLIDGWPTISDAICDYFGTPKKSYFALKAAYRNVLPIVTEEGRLVVVNDTRKPVSGAVRIVEAATGAEVLACDYKVGANGLADVAPAGWNGQGLFKITYTVGGETYKTHYLHGLPPFKWSDVSAWMKE